MRGYLSATFLKRFCQDAGIDPTKLFDTFDLITGTSIGGIQALGYAYGKTPAEMLTFFETKGSQIFAYSSILPLSVYKMNVIMGLPTYPSTFYAQTALKTALQDVLGTATLGDLPGKVLIPTWNADDDQALILSNIGGMEPFLQGSAMLAVDAGLSTSAAPLYFPPASALGKVTLDGGVYQNNPVALAFSVAKKLFPAVHRFCVLSVGTGIGYTNFVPQTSLMLSQPTADLELMQDVDHELNVMRQRLMEKYPDQADTIDNLTQTLGGIAPYNVDYLFYLMNNVFIPGPQELSTQLMAFQTKDVFDDVFFYRFQYQFKEGEISALDSYDAQQLANWANYANKQYDIDQPLIQNFIAHLNGAI